jgi:PPK2 family polyphosphate:nucleotide phosphotransferase
MARTQAKTEKAAKKKADPEPQPTVTDLLKLPQGPVDLAGMDPRATSLAPGDKDVTRAAMPALGERLADLQERLWAESRVGGRRRLLLVLQGMDTSGKGGTVRHVVGQMDPTGCRVTAFKVPTPEERRHPFLWRIREALPQAGDVGVFDRSHYEDVIVVRVHNLVPRATWSRRYAVVNQFERSLAADCTIVKVFLHISYEEQRERLRARLLDPTKRWKFNPKDIDERRYWDDYREAYEAALEKCNTEAAPWYVVPADRRWYRNWAISNLLIEQMEAMKPRWPDVDFDIEEQLRRLDET